MKRYTHHYVLTLFNREKQRIQPVKIEIPSKDGVLEYTEVLEFTYKYVLTKLNEELKGHTLIGLNSTEVIEHDISS